MTQGTFTRLTYERLGVILTNSPGYKNSGSTFEDLSRVQSVSYGFLNDLKKIKSIGSDSIALLEGKSPIMRAPNVDFQVEYFFSDTNNEKISGLYIGEEGSVLKNISESVITDDINILIVGSNQDSHKDIVLLNEEGFEGYNIIGVGNAFLTSYNYTASIGSVASCSLNFSAGNIVFDVYKKLNLPKLPSLSLGSVNNRSEETLSLNSTSFLNSNPSTINAIKPGDIQVSIKKLEGQKGGADISFLPMVQSISINLEIPRETIYGMGSNYPFNKKIKLPGQGSISLELILNKFESTTAQKLFDESSLYEIKVEHLRGQEDSLFMEIDKAQLESENFDQSIQNNSSVRIQMSYNVSKINGLKIFKRSPED